MDDPYEILNIPLDATPSKLAANYKKLVLKHHPDRKSGCLEMYLKVKKAYEFLLSKAEFSSLYSEFKTKYLDSKEEHDDLLRIYIRSKGNMKKIVDSHILSEYIDEDRLRAIIEVMIGEKKTKRFKEFKKRIPKRLKHPRSEKMEIELGEMLANSEKKRQDFIKELERKYINNLEYKEE